MPHRILLVDDEPHILRLTELSIRKGNYEIIIARNGLDAIECVTLHKPDLVIMDVQMPGMDGLQALQILKSNPDTAKIPVIVLTARGHQLTRQDAERIGASAFLTKPFSPTQLLAETQRILAE